MHPQDPQPSTSKRKTAGEDDPMNGNAAKKLKKEVREVALGTCRRSYRHL